MASGSAAGGLDGLRVRDGGLGSLRVREGRPGVLPIRAGRLGVPRLPEGRPPPPGPLRFGRPRLVSNVGRGLDRQVLGGCGPIRRHRHVPGRRRRRLPHRGEGVHRRCPGGPVLGGPVLAGWCEGRCGRAEGLHRWGEGVDRVCGGQRRRGGGWGRAVRALPDHRVAVGPPVGIPQEGKETRSAAPPNTGVLDERAMHPVGQPGQGLEEPGHQFARVAAVGPW